MRGLKQGEGPNRKRGWVALSPPHFQMAHRALFQATGHQLCLAIPVFKLPHIKLTIRVGVPRKKMSGAWDKRSGPLFLLSGPFGARGALSETLHKPVSSQALSLSPGACSPRLLVPLSCLPRPSSSLSCARSEPRRRKLNNESAHRAASGRGRLPTEWRLTEKVRFM